MRLTRLDCPISGRDTAMWYQVRRGKTACNFYGQGEAGASKRMRPKIEPWGIPMERIRIYNHLILANIDITSYHPHGNKYLLGILQISLTFREKRPISLLPDVGLNIVSQAWRTVLVRWYWTVQLLLFRVSSWVVWRHGLYESTCCCMTFLINNWLYMPGETQHSDWVTETEVRLHIS